MYHNHRWSLELLYELLRKMGWSRNTPAVPKCGNCSDLCGSQMKQKISKCNNFGYI